MKYSIILLPLVFCSCGSRPGKATAELQATPSAAQSPQPADLPRLGRRYGSPPARRQTVLLRISNFNPADSITVIETHYRKAEGKELYREYRFITHNRNSPAHRFFESRYLDSVYMSYLNDPSYRDFYDQMLPDSVKSEYIAPEIRNFNGYWVNLKEYKGDYYLDDDWSWHISFHIADSVKTDLYMDGPYPRKSGRQQCFPRAAYCSATTGRFAALLQVRLAAYRGRRHPKGRLPAFGRKRLFRGSGASRTQIRDHPVRQQHGRYILNRHEQ